MHGPALWLLSLLPAGQAPEIPARATLAQLARLAGDWTGTVGHASIAAEAMTEHGRA